MEEIREQSLMALWKLLVTPKNYLFGLTASSRVWKERTLVSTLSRILPILVTDCLLFQPAQASLTIFKTFAVLSQPPRVTP